MKKRFLSASLAVILTSSAVIPVSMQEVRAANETSSQVEVKEERLSAKEFFCNSSNIPTWIRDNASANH
ncbi:hypothetical protein ABH966_004285 [Lysinibacillus sp. RC46]